MQDRREIALRLAGAINFRSLGGLPAAGGRRIRPHALMRADRLSALSDADWRTLAGTGIVTICDLRSAAERVMIEIYRRFPRYMGGTLRAIADRLLDGGAPLLVHCSAGKDRTGFVVAMLLHALEVPEELIRADYLASRSWPGADSHRASLEARLGGYVPATELRAAVDTVLDVRDHYLDAALAAVALDFGSIDRYLASAAGLDNARLDLLRTRLLA